MANSSKLKYSLLKGGGRLWKLRRQSPKKLKLKRSQNQGYNDSCASVETCPSAGRRDTLETQEVKSSEKKVARPLPNIL